MSQQIDLHLLSLLSMMDKNYVYLVLDEKFEHWLFLSLEQLELMLKLSVDQLSKQQLVKQPQPFLSSPCLPCFV